MKKEGGLLLLLGAFKRTVGLSLVKSCQSGDKSVKDNMSLPSELPLLPKRLKITTPCCRGRQLFLNSHTNK